MTGPALIDPWADLPAGRRLEARKDRPANWIGEMGVLTRATEETLEAARRYFPEVGESDLEHDGRVWTDKGSGTVYRRAGGQPLAAVDPKACADVFTIRDGYLVFLRREQAEPETVVELGVVGGRTAGRRERIA